MKLRICFRCKEFISLISLGSGAWEELKQEAFDHDHKDHALVTIEIDRIDLKDFILKDLYYNEIISKMLFA